MALTKDISSPPILFVRYQLFDHKAWDGFHCWDLVMPLFLFMAGASIPFAMDKYKNEPNKWAIYRKILKRVLILFILGAIVQGNLLGLDPNHLYLYSNTLQAIATGYLIAAIFFLNLTTKGQIIGTIALMLLYWLPMTFFGDFTPTGNFAEQVDKLTPRVSVM